MFWTGLEDPLSVPEIPEILSARIELPFAETLTKTSRDCFALLPWEILEKIGLLLPTRDALNLRLASASFLPLYVSGCFWASRFSANGERGFLFEGRKTRDALGWLTLHRLSRLSYHPPGLQNRRRLWGLVKVVVDIIKRNRANVPSCATNQLRAQYGWTQVNCKIHFEARDECWIPFNGGCRSLGTCIINLPDDVIQVGITTIKTGLYTYVSGIRFMSKSKTNTKVGYSSEQEEFVLVTSGLYGFRVAMSQSGITALQVVSKNGFCSRWAGDPISMPVCSRLVGSEPISRLAISYDVSDFYPRTLRLLK